MPTFVTRDIEDLWGEVDVICCASNSSIRKDGKLVPTRGFGKWIDENFPEAYFNFGREILENAQKNGMKTFNFHLGEVEGQRVALLQTKTTFLGRAGFDLVYFSSMSLKKYAEEHPDLSFAAQHFGMGDGKLDPMETHFLVDMMPDNVTFAYRKMNDPKNILSHAQVRFNQMHGV